MSTFVETKQITLMRYWLFVIELIISILNIQAQDFSGRNYYFNLTTFEGLASNTVGAIQKDSLGFIWIGTKKGLCRFDGCEIKEYPALKGQDIWTIEELDKDTLIIGTVNNLFYFSRCNNTLIKSDISSAIVRDIQKVNSSKFLVATEGGLYLVTNHVSRRIPLGSGVSPCNNVRGLLRENENVYWFATDDGLGRIDLRTLKPTIYRMPSGLTNTNSFICLTKVGQIIYLGSFNKGVFVFNTQNKIFSKVNGFEHNLIMAIQAANDKLYVGTNGRGLKIMSLIDGTIQVVSHKEKEQNSIASNTITAFLYDDGIQWIGTQFGGISYTPLIGSKFRYYSLDSFYSTDYRVRCFYMFPDGDKLIGTRTGLFYTSDSKHIIRTYRAEDTASGLRSEIILYIKEIHGKILIATYGGGIHLFDKNTLSIKDFSKEEPFLYNCFFHFTEDADNHLWFASQDGLYESSFDGHIIRKFDTNNSLLTSNVVYYLFADHMNRLWIGTKFGLCLMDLQTGRIDSRTFKGKIDSEVKYITESSSKYIWVCTDKGLYQINSDLNIVNHYTDKDVLPENEVMSFQEDARGDYWIATSKNILRFNPKSKFHYTYQRLDGLNGLEFNNSVCISKDSLIWWANEGGLLYTDYNGFIHSNRKDIHPLITTCIVGNTSYDCPFLKKNNIIDVPHNTNEVTLKFSNMDYALPYANIYEYKLEGYDDVWIQKRGVNEVRYQNLPAGRYVFKLRNPNNPNQEQQLIINVKRSYTAILIIGGIFILVAVLVFYFRRQIFVLKRRLTNERQFFNSIQQMQGEKVLTEKQTDQLADRLMAYMEEKKPYLNPDLTINEVAINLQCTESDLSQLLNSRMKVNFSKFINTYRVNEIKRRATPEALNKYTLRALAEQCGFKSKTTFYRVFKNITGHTPAEYYKIKGFEVTNK